MKNIVKTPGFKVVIIMAVIGLICVGYFVIGKIVDDNNIYTSPFEDNTSVPKEIKKNKSNEYNIITPDKYELPKLYFTEYLNYLKNDFEKAWELVPEKIKKDDYKNNIDEYKTFVKKTLNSNDSSTIIKKFGKQNYLGGTLYSVINEDGLRIIILEKAIWDYEAYFLGKTDLVNDPTAN